MLDLQLDLSDLGPQIHYMSCVSTNVIHGFSAIVLPLPIMNLKFAIPKSFSATFVDVFFMMVGKTLMLQNAVKFNWHLVSVSYIHTANQICLLCCSFLPPVVHFL